MPVAAVAQGVAKIGKGTVKAGAAVARVGARAAKSGGNFNQAKRTEEFRRSNKLARSMQRGQKSDMNSMRQTKPSSPMRNVHPNPILNIPPPRGSTGGEQLPQQEAANDNQESDQEPASATEEPQDETEDAEEESAIQQKVGINQVMQQARIQGAIAESIGIQAQAEQPEDSGASEEEMKKIAKRVLPRGATFTMQGIADGVTLSTGGAGIIFTIFIYMFSLGFLNYEMLTGKLSWDPIPMPIDKNADLLKGLIVFLNIVVALTIIVLNGTWVIFLMMIFSPKTLVDLVGMENILSIIKFFS